MDKPVPSVPFLAAVPLTDPGVNKCLSPWFSFRRRGCGGGVARQGRHAVPRVRETAVGGAWLVKNPDVLAVLPANSATRPA